KLEELVEKSGETTNNTEYTKINTEIHDIFLSFAENETLTYLMGNIQDIILNNRNFSSYNDERKRKIIKEHKDIIESIKLNDKDKAAKAMRKHIRNGYEYIEFIRNKRNQSN